MKKNEFKKKYPMLSKHELFSLIIDNSWSNAERDEMRDCIADCVIDKQQLKAVLDEEVSKPESHIGMVGWTIPSFHQVIDSMNIPQHLKNMIKSKCTFLLHKNGLKVDCANYHDRILKRLGLDD